MKRKIYLSLLATGFICMAVTLVISTWFFWQSSQRQISQELQLTMRATATGLDQEEDKVAYLQALSQGPDRGLRLTWIDENGQVLFDSASMADSMENHQARPEVQEALKEGSGTSVRNSQTLSKALYYYAQKQPDGTILRISLERDTFYAHFFSLLPWLLLFLGLAALICIKVSRYLTASLLRPLREAIVFIKKIGDPRAPLTTPPQVERELQPLVNKVFYQSKTIQENIQQREKMRREFTSNVTHELKTPLTSISGFAEMLANGMFQQKEDVLHFGSLIQRESRRMLGMIEEILHLSRLEDGRHVLHCQRVEVSSLIADVVDFLAPVAQEKQIRIHSQMTPIKITADPGLLRELFMNLLDNAIKYNHPGGEVYITLSEKERQFCAVIRDTGIGIPQDKLERIFERFYRVDSSRSQKVSGTGLGLAIVKHIVEEHGGTIIVRSKEGKGTTITVFLPAF